MQLTALKRKASPQQVLADLASFSNARLARLMPAMLALRAQRGRHVLPRREAELLMSVNRTLPPESRARYRRLTAKRRAEELTPAEHRDLLRLSDDLGLLNAERVKSLLVLAGLRQTTVPVLMDSLGLKSMANV